MSLIEWNATMTAGRGRTGTLYLIAEAGGRWSVSVDGDMLCLTGAAAQAVQRTEYLEALKHVACGRAHELTFDQLAHAAVVAGEMKEAAETVLANGTLPPDELESVDQYGRCLGDLLRLIAAEQDRRRKRAPS
ncbi:MAG TPA: hypothetical protein VF342_00380 [Alphaproteobacteria bacterium]